MRCHSGEPLLYLSASCEASPVHNVTLPLNSPTPKVLPGQFLPLAPGPQPPPPPTDTFHNTTRVAAHLLQGSNGIGGV